jgi:hypothetical protein
MNERIKQLAEQAGVSILLGDLTDEDTGKVERSRLEIFAELIVLECARKIEDMIDNGWYADTGQLKNHFGVEE